MKTNFFVIVLLILGPLSINPIFGQKIVETAETWAMMRQDTTPKFDSITVGLSIGADFSTLSTINPRVGEGQGNTAWGGLITFFANFTKKKTIWDSRLTLQLSGLRTGDNSQPYIKTADNLQVNMLFGRKIRGNVYFAGMGDLRTQLLPTYGTGYFDSNKNEFPLSSNAFSPATIKLMPGILWRPNPEFKMLLSVISTKMTVVTNSNLADATDSLGNAIVGLYGNAAGETLTKQFGAELRGELMKKMFKDKVMVSSIVDLYANYLDKPENIAFEWYNSIDLMVFKNISINLKSDWFYDHNVLTQIGGDPMDLGRRMFIRNSVFLRYNLIF
jgi:hypothetical protein